MSVPSVSVANWPIYQSVSGTMLLAGSIPAGSNTIGAVTVSNRVDVSGAFFQPVQPVSGTVSTAWTHSTVTDAMPSAAEDLVVAPTAGQSYQVVLDVYTISGSLSLSVEEARGNTWVVIHEFPRVTVAGVYTSPVIPLTGTNIRYSHVAVGSIQRAITRTQMACPATITRQRFDRTVDLQTLGSATAPVWTDQATKNVTVTVAIASATTAPQLTLMATDDCGESWYAVSDPIVAVAGTVSRTVNGTCAQAYRAEVTTAGALVVASYVLVRAF